jgi:2-oxoglutarate dehydrogenase E2 component (dihydrolipoamide succinyltransferase)
MAKIEVVMPQMGESITTGTITKWHKAPGDQIDIDELLLEISTDKVESEIPSPTEGRVEQILFEEGETIDVGKVIAVIEDDLSVPFDGSSAGPATASAPKPQAPAATETASSAAPAAASSSNTSAAQGETRRFYTPLVKKLAKEAGVELVELESIQGSGAGGRVNKADFEAYLANRSASPAVPASAPAPSAAAKPAAAPAPSVPAYSAQDRVEIIPMDNMRKAIARNMVASKQTSPHVNSISEVDLSHLVKFREGFKGEFQKQEGFKLTYTPFIMLAIIKALKEHPYVNASIDGDNIVLKKDIHLGCAVAVPGNGLVVPVIKQADTLNMVGLCRAVNDLANRARAKKLSMDELQGGTFTFTNVGSFGTLMATPVILQPQVGIYASGVIQKRPIVTKDDAIAVRHMMYGTHSYDHRLVDGELGGLFLESVHRNLREMDPKSLF